ncbi:hypothetical protein IMCC9480_3401 [Oxalobacteraceae bacterium IMCC9480]|nr:hypothetical protein IMCC9480_3401 [Oxalobacteraceae bacterium IMCC9480]
MFGDFFLLEANGREPAMATRVHLEEKSERNEAWLRDTIFAHPTLLPIKDLDPAFGPLIPLCVELQVKGTGRVDAVFINRLGRLTLVECKLWRNPEARRKVVAQVLDYASAIRRWSYSDLQRQVTMALRGQCEIPNGNLPYELVKAHVPDLNEQQFVDDTVRAMRNGRFSLLIAGDGIREGVADITELIDRNAASGFSFGLVEVALYQFADGALVIQPRIIAKTQIIERTVITVRTAGEATTLEITDDNDDGIATSIADTGNIDSEFVDNPKKEEFRAWWAPVLATDFDDPDQSPGKLYWPNHIRLPLPWPQTWIAAFRSGGNSGLVGIYTAGRDTQAQDMMTLLAENRGGILDQLGAGAEYRQFSGSNSYTFSIVRNASEFPSEGAKQQWLSATLNNFINTLRPRIKALWKARQSGDE